MQSHWDKLPTIRVVDAGYLLAGMEPQRKWQYAPPLVANFFNLICEKTGAVTVRTMPGGRTEITQVEYQTLKAQYGLTPTAQPQVTAPSPAPVVPAPATDGGELEAPERRLIALRELGGTAKWERGSDGAMAWQFTGITKLVQQEKAQGRKRRDEKTIREDLREAAEAESMAKRNA